MTDKKRRGTPRPNAGRPHLNGSRPGQGEYTQRKTATLPVDMIDFLTGLGNGNFSAGVRIVTEKYQQERQAG